MSKTRVFIVDGDVRSRHFLRDAVTATGYEVAGSVSNGELALKKIPMVTPDVVFLETDLPGEDSIETLINIRKTHSHLPVIMLSSKTGNASAAKVLEAFAAGANGHLSNTDFIDPEPDTRENFNQSVAAKVIPLLRESAQPRITEKKQKWNLPSLFSRPSAPRAEKKQTASERVDILVIAVSTGGPEALNAILPKLPEDFPVPILIVQHMPKEFTTHFAQRMNSKCRLPFAEARSGDTLHPGKAWLAPGGKHLTVSSDGRHIRLITTLDPPENSCRPAADVLFRSVARYYGPHTLALVLTGMGKDGLEGSREIREAGGRVLVQDESTRVVQSQLADQVVPLNDIANEILRRVWEKRRAPSTSEAATLNC